MRGKWMSGAAGVIMLLAGAYDDLSCKELVGKGIGLSVAVSRNSAGEPELTAVVSNHTKQTVARWQNCNHWNGMNVRFASEDHRDLLLDNPERREWCPDTLFALPPDSVLIGRSIIPDTLYTWDGIPVAMSPGLYYVEIRFEWREAVVARRHVLSHATSFSWPVPAEPTQGGDPGYVGSSFRQLPLQRSSGATGAIRCTIVDSTTSQTLPFAAVRIVESDHALPIATDNILHWYGAGVTNVGRDGTLVFSDLPVGFYDVRATMTSYRRDSARIAVTPGDTIQVTFRLRRDERFR